MNPWGLAETLCLKVRQYLFLHLRLWRAARALGTRKRRYIVEGSAVEEIILVWCGKGSDRRSLTHEGDPDTFGQWESVPLLALPGETESILQEERKTSAIRACHPIDDQAYQCPSYRRHKSQQCRISTMSRGTVELTKLVDIFIVLSDSDKCNRTISAWILKARFQVSINPVPKERIGLLTRISCALVMVCVIST